MEAGQGPGGRAWFSTVTPDSMESLREKMGPKGTPDRRLSDQRVRELGDTLGRESDYTSQRWPVELAVLGGPPELGDAEPDRKSLSGFLSILSGLPCPLCLPFQPTTHTHTHTRRTGRKLPLSHSDKPMAYKQSGF